MNKEMLMLVFILLYVVVLFYTISKIKKLKARSNTISLLYLLTMIIPLAGLLFTLLAGRGSKVSSRN